jgi:hypothetical protein
VPHFILFKTIHIKIPLMIFSGIFLLTREYFR